MKNYVRPSMWAEAFVTNSYIAECYDQFTAELTCALPGNSTSEIEDGVTGGAATDWHGTCGAAAQVDFQGTTATGCESIDGVAIKERAITDLVIGEQIPANTFKDYSKEIGKTTPFDSLVVGRTYKATWTSFDGENNTGYYYHYGRAVIKGTPSSRPNHS